MQLAVLLGRVDPFAAEMLVIRRSINLPVRFTATNFPLASSCNETGIAVLLLMMMSIRRRGGTFVILVDAPLINHL